MELITFDYFSITFQIFLCVFIRRHNNLIGRRGALQIQTRKPIKSIRIASNFTNQSWLEVAKEGTVHIKNMQGNKMNTIQCIGYPNPFTENIQM